MGTPESNWASRWRSRRAARREFRADLNAWGKAGKDKVDEDKLMSGWTQGERDAHRARSPEERLERVTNELNHKRGVKREVVIKGMLGAGVLAVFSPFELIRLDQRTRVQQAHKQEQEGRNLPTRLEVLEECRDLFPTTGESFITVGGLGCVDSQYHARPMYEEGFPVQQEQTTPMTYLVASLKGKTIPEVADIIEAAAENSGSLSYYGQSNGSVVVLEALHYLKKEKGIVIPINRFVLNCSPFDFGDAQLNYIEEFFSRFLVGTRYEPGMIGQFLWLLRENWTIERNRIFDSFLDAVQESWERTQNGEPPGPWIADLRILVSSRLNERDFTGIITKNTKMLFLNSSNDDVVFNNPAAGKYRSLARRYGAEFTEEPLPAGIRHGDSQAGGETAQRWINRTAQRGRRIPD